MLFSHVIFIHKTAVHPSPDHVANSDQSQMGSDILSKADCMGNSHVTCIYTVSHCPYKCFLRLLTCLTSAIWKVTSVYSRQLT